MSLAPRNTTLPLRTDYEALRVSPGQAAAIVELAERFVRAVEELYPD